MTVLTKQPKIAICSYDNKEYKYRLGFVAESNVEGYYIYDFYKKPYVAPPADPSLASLVGFNLSEFDSKCLRIRVNDSDLDRIISDPAKYWEYLYHESKGSTAIMIICRIKNDKFDYCYLSDSHVLSCENFYKVVEDPEWDKKYSFPGDHGMRPWYGHVYKMNVWIDADVDEETRERHFEELLRKYIEENK